jgi:hypothetical protein
MAWPGPQCSRVRESAPAGTSLSLALAVHSHHIVVVSLGRACVGSCELEQPMGGPEVEGRLRGSSTKPKVVQNLFRQIPNQFLKRTRIESIKTA